MDPLIRATELVQLLLGRPPTAAEQAQFEGFAFDCDTFLIELVCSDEAAEHYGPVAEHLIDHLRIEMARDAMPHKLAHDLALSQEELAKLQGKLDRLHGSLLELLKHEDRIVGIFDTVRGIQSDFNTVRQRLEQVETNILQSAGADDDC